MVHYDVCLRVLFFFFKQKTAYEMRISDWSSDVCSSDLAAVILAVATDVAFALEHFEHIGAQPGRRGKDGILLRALAVADTGEHITQGIGQCHNSEDRKSVV